MTFSNVTVKRKTDHNTIWYSSIVSIFHIIRSSSLSLGSFYSINLMFYQMNLKKKTCYIFYLVYIFTFQQEYTPDDTFVPPSTNNKQWVTQTGLIFFLFRCLENVQSKFRFLWLVLPYYDGVTIKQLDDYYDWENCFV